MTPSMAGAVGDTLRRLGGVTGHCARERDPDPQRLGAHGKKLSRVVQGVTSMKSYQLMPVASLLLSAACVGSAAGMSEQEFIRQ
jgi:hypothetical protein